MCSYSEQYWLPSYIYSDRRSRTIDQTWSNFHIEQKFRSIIFKITFVSNFTIYIYWLCVLLYCDSFPLVVLLHFVFPGA